MGTRDETSSAVVWGKYPAGGARIGDNGPLPKREGGVSGNQACWGNVEAVRSSD